MPPFCPAIFNDFTESQIYCQQTCAPGELRTSPRSPHHIFPLWHGLGQPGDVAKKTRNLDFPKFPSRHFMWLYVSAFILNAGFLK